MKHGDNSFVTLTYDNEHLPSDLSLDPKTLQDWLKRLRRLIEPEKVRYYLVGEYGDQTHRPHYHVALFGFATCLHGNSDAVCLPHPSHRCKQCNTIQLSWPFGSVHLGSLTQESAGYVAGYVTKKMTSKEDPRLNGRHPEFARMSLRPGIGATAVSDLINYLHSAPGATHLDLNGDVPSVLRRNGKLNPLGRYIRRKLREAYGFKDSGTPKELLQKLSQEMHELLKDDLPAKTHSTSREEIRFNHQQALIEKNKQKIRSIEAREKLYGKKGEI